MERKNQEVDWFQYLNSIRAVCPHSIESFQRDRIKLVPFLNIFTSSNWIDDVDEFDALLFIGDNTVSLGLLKKLVDYLDIQYPSHEFFYSYPDEGEYSTPVPCLIAQNRATLNRARKEYKEKIRRELWNG